MPYPYSNSLGKNPPPSPNALNYYGGSNVNISGNTFKKKKPSAFHLTQSEMLDQLYGASPKTLKFPYVLPMAVTKDYPGSHPANKWGKPDPTMIPDDKVDTPKGNWEELAEAELKEKYYAKVIGDFSTAAVDPYYYKQPPVPASYFLGKVLNDYDYQTHANKITVQCKVGGLSVEGTVFGVAQKIADHAAFNMNSDMLSHVLDETFAKMKQEIMKKVIEEASKK